MFRKYEFPSEEFYRELKGEQDFGYFTKFVELGNLRNETFSVDVLWIAGAPSNWEPYEVWNFDDNGSHTFAGYEFGKDREDNNLNI
jgi:hypothetical protein